MSINMKGAAGISLVVAIVGAIVGFVIVDSVTTDTSQTFLQTDELTLLTNTNVSLTRDNVTTFNSITFSGDKTLPAANYTVTYSPCCSVALKATEPTNNTAHNVSYHYAKDEYFDSSISRTISGYIVPIGILGVLAMAAMFAI